MSADLTFLLRTSFHLFAKLLPENGTLVINGDIDKIEEITSDLSCRVITFGKEASLDYSAANITYNEQGNASFDVVKNGQNVAHLALAVGGEHNVYNALAAIAVADILGVPAETILHIIHIKSCGVFSSHILIHVQKHYSQNLLKHSHMQTM